MYCSLDWLTRKIALARVHKDGGRLGDDWTWGCVVVRQRDTAIIMLAQASPKPSESRAFLRALREAGMTRRRYERRGVRRFDKRGVTVVVEAGQTRMGFWSWLCQFWRS